VGLCFLVGGGGLRGGGGVRGWGWGVVGGVGGVGGGGIPKNNKAIVKTVKNKLNI